MKLKLKLKSNRRGAGFLGVYVTGVCREVTLIYRQAKAQRVPRPPPIRKNAPSGAFFIGVGPPARKSTA